MVMYFMSRLLVDEQLVAGPGSRTTCTRNNVMNTKWLIEIKMAGMRIQAEGQYATVMVMNDVSCPH